jgi:hypothetical protein
MDLAVEAIHGQFWASIGTRPVFIAVKTSLPWFNYVSGVYLVEVSLPLIGQQG